VTRPQTAPALPVVAGTAGAHNALALVGHSGGGAAGASALHCATCDRPRLFGFDWCGTRCRHCLADWIGAGQPAPAETGRIGRTYRLQYGEQVSA
jgi:hypothetical protein